MYAVGAVETIHIQPTIGEYTYAYTRLWRARSARDYMVTFAREDSFSLRLEPVEGLGGSVKLLHSDPIPVEVDIVHNIGILPSKMHRTLFGVLVDAVLLDAVRELGLRCPRRTSCICELQAHSCTYLPQRSAFKIEGFITG